MDFQKQRSAMTLNPAKGAALYGFSYRKDGQFVISGYENGTPKCFAFDEALLALGKSADKDTFARLLKGAKAGCHHGAVCPKRARMHFLLDAPVVLEIRSALALCLTCNTKGEALAEKLGFAWETPVVDKVVCEADGAILIPAADLASAEAKLAETVAALSKEFGFTDATLAGDDFDDAALALLPVVRMACGQDKPASALFFTDETIKAMSDAQGFETLTRPAGHAFAYHIGDDKLFIDSADAQTVIKAIADFREKTGHAPALVGIGGLGLIACDSCMPCAVAVKEAVLTAIFLHGKIEVRTPQAAKKAGCRNAQGRLAEKIALVTGSAQGFGKGIALAMAEEGAHVIIADLNEEGAVACANELNEKYGPYTAVAVGANVGDEDSVKAMTDAAVRAFGGLDVLVNNAGIVRAGGLEEMTKSSFELVTSINYTAYFLCTREASRVMKLQHLAAPEYMMDIIEINSKSGLSGSNKNFAYAGSKFGGLGLTQSFAMELAPYAIKVNAICPGNLLDGPLWSDPVRGLFVQYLNAGKVPGAKTTEDVKKFYEAKVPLGRGCREPDVARAILYIIEQTYETGQAVPVTGGQEMLN